eukprot:6055942-Prymnesium_polylepis.3
MDTPTSHRYGVIDAADAIDMDMLPFLRGSSFMMPHADGDDAGKTHGSEEAIAAIVNRGTPSANASKDGKNRSGCRRTSLRSLPARCSGHRPGAIDTKAGAKRTGGIFYGNAAVIELGRALTKLAKVLRIDLEAIETTKQLLEVFHDFWLKLDEDRQL